MGQGLVAPSAGPINSAMAGASTAAPIEFGSSYWNPAVLSGLSDQEFLLGAALVLPDILLQSSIQARSILGQFPATTRSGTAKSSSGVLTNPAVGYSFRPEGSDWTFGVGLFGLAAGGANFAGDASTPVLGPRIPPKYFGVGPIYSNIAILAITPMASYQMTDRLSVGGGPIITTATAQFDPAFFAPNGRDAFGLLSFPSATNSHPFWGGGFQVGLFYEINDDWNVGFSYKSPVWQQKWNSNAADPNLVGRRIGVQAQLPEVFSWGVAYKGLPKTLIDLDLRYFDYANASLFGQRVIDGGLGWRSVFAVALGAQYAATEKLTLRAGYLFNTNPIPAPVTLFNVQAPVITEHTLSLGASYNMSENMTLSFAWMHSFTNSIEGSILQIPGSSVRMTEQVDFLVAGLNVSFGSRKKKPPTVPVVVPEGVSPEQLQPPPLPVSATRPQMPAADSSVVPTSTSPSSAVAGS
jgi:long-chain fatty acid transport protein